MTAMGGRQGLGQVFRIPALLAASSVAGLAGSLVGDGGWDVAGAALLLAPAAVALAKLAPGLWRVRWPAPAATMTLQPRWASPPAGAGISRAS